ncbi:hypothetical protein [Phocoenobacter atlanticus]|uniref:hypothetical protein n=1 Tax=Phocoenobacter atlanticus TaxID=3416742 RepID=UPI002750C325|nr:hypothetical protein [Pasteurella atlantica]MDP8101468.1 hypothetical protein [Pasteurella atlantica]
MLSLKTQDFKNGVLFDLSGSPDEILSFLNKIENDNKKSAEKVLLKQQKTTRKSVKRAKRKAQKKARKTRK